MPQEGGFHEHAYCSSVPEVGPRKCQLWVHCLQVPLEGLAAQLFPQLQPASDIAVVHISDGWSLGVIVLLVFVHPHFDQTQVVLGEGIAHAPREGVGVAGSEDVTHM